MSVTTGSGVKKICVEVVCGSGNLNGNDVHNDSVQLGHHRHHGNNSDEDLEDFSDDSTSNTSSDDDRSSNGLEDSIMITSSNESNCEENKENTVNVNKMSKGELDSILAKTLLNTATLSSNPSGPITDNATGPVHPTGLTQTPSVVTSETMPKNDNESPKVIVEHKPLPSIYDLQQMSAACDTLDDNITSVAATLTSTVNNINNKPSVSEADKLSKENDSGVSEDDEDDEPSPSPIFDPVLRGTAGPKQPLLPSPPKAIYGNGNDRFWSNNGGSHNQNHNNHRPRPSLIRSSEVPP